jgi:hypothetical protein
MLYKDFVREMFVKHRGKMAAKDIMKLAAEEWPAVRDGKMGKMGKMSKMPKKGKARGGALSMPGLGDINSAIAVGSAALPVISGVADALGSLFGGHTQTTIERATAQVPDLTDAQRAEILRKIQGKGLKKMKKTRGGNVGGELYSDDDGKRGMVESATVNVPNKGGKLKSRGAGMVGGSMPKKMNYIPKETNVMSSFYQFDTLPKSNYAPRSNMSKGGAFIMPGGNIIGPPHGEDPMGGGLFDTLGSLMPLAFMI